MFIPFHIVFSFILPHRKGFGIRCNPLSQKRLKEGEYIVANIRPVGDRVVVKPVAKEEVTRSGIVIPDTAKEKPQQGIVIAVGTGRLLDTGELAPMDVREGDRVTYAKYGGTEFVLEDDEYLVLRENDILAIIG